MADTARARTQSRDAVAQQAADDGAGTRERILGVAGRLFLQRGYDGTGVGLISKQVGVSPPTLYWHFPSKDRILEAFLRQTVLDNIAAIDETVTAETPSERLQQFVAAHVTYQLRYYERYQAFSATHGFDQLFAALPAEGAQEIRALADEYVERMRAILRSGVERGEFEIESLTVAARAILTMTEYVISWFRPDGPLSPEEVSRQYSVLAHNMVRARAADRPR